jgi:hypothetical protein
MADDPALTIGLSGAGWQAQLVVDPPGPAPAVPKPFQLPQGRGLRRVEPLVRYTQAVNQVPSGWETWHVKVYQCDNEGDAEELRGYLRRQALAVQRANARVEGRSEVPIEPPWAVVPVHIIRGDGAREDLEGTVYTSIDTPGERILGELRDSLPAWLIGTPPEPQRYLLAVSPHMDQVRWQFTPSSPRIEQLAEFRAMAAGLDALHAMSTVHCDIKPANVCWYRTAQSSGYVLIDADAVTNTTPTPETLRTAHLYEHRGVREWRREQKNGRRLSITPGTLLAQDRFGFALVVLAVLAGRDWTEGALLGAYDGPRGPARRADSGPPVAEALTDHWRDTGDREWGPLIRVAAEPFGTDLTQPGTWAVPWINRLIEAQEQCVRRTTPVAPRRIPVSSRRTTRVADLDWILAEAGRQPATRRLRTQHGYRALRRRAEAVAIGAAVRAAALSAGLLVAIVLVLIVGALGMGK